MSTHGDLSSEVRCLLDDLSSGGGRAESVASWSIEGAARSGNLDRFLSPASRESSVTPFVQYDAVERVLRLDLRWWGVLVPAVGLARRGAAER